MFDDERINFYLGNIYRKSIIISLLFSMLYLALVCFGFFSFSSIINPLIVILTTTICLIYGKILTSKEKTKDERYYKIKSQYYLKSSYIILISFIVGFILSVCLSFNKDVGYAPNTYLIIMEIINFIFLSYQFKKNDIYFNYSFIDSTKSQYYKKVWKNILKLAKYVLILYLVIFLISIIFYIKAFITFLILYLLAGLISIGSLSLTYFIISWIDKVLYDEKENKKNFSYSLLISMLFYLLFFLLTTFLQIYLIAIGKSDITINSNYLGATLANLNLQIKYYSYYQIAFICMSLANLLTYLNNKSKSFKIVEVLIVFLLLNLVTSFLLPLIFNKLIDINFIFFQINNYINYFFSITSEIIILFLFIFLYKEYHYTKWLILLGSLFLLNTILFIIGNNIHYLYIFYYIVEIIESIILLINIIKIKKTYEVNQ